MNQGLEGLCRQGRPITGEPPLLKTRIHLRRGAAEQLWKVLHRVGWQQWNLAGELLLSRRAKGGMGDNSVLVST